MATRPPGPTTTPDEALPALPGFVEVDAADHWRCIDFIGDLHLCESAPRTVEGFAHYLATTPADAVVILGDLFEVWVGDDACDGGFESRCVDLLADAACGRNLAFMHGNRDFLVGLPTLAACGMLGLADPTVLVAFGERVLLTHGDALCLGDTEYQAFRAQVRTAAWQRAFLGRTLAARRQIARELRERSRTRQRHRRASETVDVDAAAAVQWMHLSAAPVMIHGHTHRPGSSDLAPGYRRHVLSDWHLEADSQPRRAQALRWTAAGFSRVDLAQTPADPGTVR
jgi:UDP-2,3-diacylglucosamine hydrolase